VPLPLPRVTTVKYGRVVYCEHVIVVTFGLLREAVRPNPSPMDLDLLIGIKDPVAPAEMRGEQLEVTGLTSR